MKRSKGCRTCCAKLDVHKGLLQAQIIPEFDNFRRLDVLLGEVRTKSGTIWDAAVMPYPTPPVNGSPTVWQMHPAAVIRREEPGLAYRVSCASISKPEAWNNDNAFPTPPNQG